MDEEEVREFISTASADQFIALRNKLSESNNISFKDFVCTIDRLIDLII